MPLSYIWISHCSVRNVDAILWVMSKKCQKMTIQVFFSLYLNIKGTIKKCFLFIFLILLWKGNSPWLWISVCWVWLQGYRILIAKSLYMVPPPVFAVTCFCVLLLDNASMWCGFLIIHALRKSGRERRTGYGTWWFQRGLSALHLDAPLNLVAPLSPHDGWSHIKVRTEVVCPY